MTHKVRLRKVAELESRAMVAMSNAHTWLTYALDIRVKQAQLLQEGLMRTRILEKLREDRRRILTGGLEAGERSQGESR